ncbi:MAG: asparaginase [Ramlibacter sp.]
MATGGTLAGKAASAGDSVGYRAAQLSIGEVLASVPALKAWQLAPEQVAQVDSKDMDFAIWRDLALRCRHWLAQDDVAGIVITHGTDTLEETAFFLHSVLESAKPVVLTCSMRPSTALVPDGPQNLVDAMAVASTKGAHGVVAVCAGVIHSGLDVAKQHTYRLDAFSSGDAGPVGYVEEGRARLVKEWPGCSGNARSLDKFASAAEWPRVEIVMNHAGASGAIVDALVAQKVRGLVVAGTGNGTIHRELEAALLEAQSAGVKVVRSTRCPEGRVIPHARDVLPDSGGLSPVKARIALMLELLV